MRNLGVVWLFVSLLLACGVGPAEERKTATVPPETQEVKFSEAPQDVRTTRRVGRNSRIGSAGLDCEMLCQLGAG